MKKFTIDDREMLDSYLEDEIVKGWCYPGVHQNLDYLVTMSEEQRGFSLAKYSGSNSNLIDHFNEIIIGHIECAIKNNPGELCKSWPGINITQNIQELKKDIQSL